MTACRSSSRLPPDGGPTGTLVVHGEEEVNELDDGWPSLGRFLTWDDVAAVKTAIVRASQNPNLGVPRGCLGWPGQSVFHGTSAEFADDIREIGVDMSQSHGGYFGHAFYVADSLELATSNYAEFSGDEDGGAVLEFNVEEGARILDLRNAEDYAAYQASGLNDQLGRPDIARHARLKGIDGIYDRPVGGLAIYNPKALCLVGLVRKPEVATGGPKL